MMLAKERFRSGNSDCSFSVTASLTAMVAKASSKLMKMK